jgi:hypothetical protein
VPPLLTARVDADDVDPRCRRGRQRTEKWPNLRRPVVNCPSVTEPPLSALVAMVPPVVITRRLTGEIVPHGRFGMMGA